MEKAQDQVVSGKRVSKPSDDPLLVGKIMSMRDNIKQNEQYNSNISDTIGWVQTQDTALDDITGTMNRVRDLIIYASNGSLSDTDRGAIKDETESAIGELKEILNTNFDGRYVFGGTKTTEAPFSEEKSDDNVTNGLKYDGNGDSLKREISRGVTIELEANGSSITRIGNPEESNLDSDNDLGMFLNEVVEAMGNGETDDLSGDLLGKADKFIDNILQVRSKLGATQNRLEAAEERNMSENINLKEVLSEKEDIDLAESYMEYTMMSTAYQASLSMGARILQPSLLDYLR